VDHADQVVLAVHDRQAAHLTVADVPRGGEDARVVGDGQDPLAEVARLYRERWQAELDIRAIKQTLGMKLLSCRTPERLRAELWAHLLGSNLVRCVLAQAALDKGVQARQLSFQGGVQLLDAFRWLLCCTDRIQTAALALSTALAVHRFGNRPDRYEPRELKHRQRKYAVAGGAAAGIAGAAAREGCQRSGPVPSQRPAAFAAGGLAQLPRKPTRQQPSGGCAPSFPGLCREARPGTPPAAISGQKAPWPQVPRLPVRPQGSAIHRRAHAGERRAARLFQPPLTAAGRGSCSRTGSDSWPP
jgi:hypothetical protein